MEDKELFNLVLGENEEILKTYRPNKFRAFFAQIILWGFLIILWALILVGNIFAYKAGESTMGELAGNIAFVVMWIVLMSLSLVLTHLWCNKTVYAITNKRVLIRTGRIGVDYKSLDYNMLGAVTVNVSWVDKLLHKNTGVIAFGSMSSPLVNNGMAKFVFSYIKNPYEVYKEVKAVIDASKSEANK